MSTPAEQLEQADLDAANRVVSQDQGDQTDDFNGDESGEDLSDMLADDFDESYDEGNQSIIQQQDTPAEQDDAGDQTEELSAEEQEPAAEEVEEPAQSQESSEDLSHEDLVKMLRQANVREEELRAQLAEAAPEDAQTTDTQSDQDPAEARQAAVTHLEETVYPLSQEDADLMLTEPEKVLPRLAAQMHVAILESVTQVVRAAVPNLVQSSVQQSQTRETRDSQFYTDWPALKAHAAEVEPTRRALAQLHPSLGEAEIDQRVGAYLSLQHGIVPNKEQGQQSQQPARRTQAHRPVGRGATTQTPKPKGGDNFFEGLAEDDLRDDS